MIYTIGYAKLREPAKLLHLAEQLDAIVIDVRLKPYTSFKGWPRSDLTRLLGDRYLWVEAFGNVNYKGGEVRLLDVQRGIEIVSGIPIGKSVILMCGCADHRTCHRSVVADLLAEAAGWQVEHLGVEDSGPEQPELF